MLPLLSLPRWGRTPAPGLGRGTPTRPPWLLLPPAEDQHRGGGVCGCPPLNSPSVPGKLGSQVPKGARNAHPKSLPDGCHGHTLPAVGLLTMGTGCHLPGAETAEQKDEPLPPPANWRPGPGRWREPSPRPPRPPRPHGLGPTHLDRESRRVRQEGRARGKGATLRGDAGVFLTMRYRVRITLLVGGLRRLLRRAAAERTQCGGQRGLAEMPATPRSSPHHRAQACPQTGVSGVPRGGGGGEQTGGPQRAGRTPAQAGPRPPELPRAARGSLGRPLRHAPTQTPVPPSCPDTSLCPALPPTPTVPCQRRAPALPASPPT